MRDQCSLSDDAGPTLPAGFRSQPDVLPRDEEHALRHSVTVRDLRAAR